MLRFLCVRRARSSFQWWECHRIFLKILTDLGHPWSPPGGLLICEPYAKLCASYVRTPPMGLRKKLAPGREQGQRYQTQAIAHRQQHRKSCSILSTPIGPADIYRLMPLPPTLRVRHESQHSSCGGLCYLRYAGGPCYIALQGLGVT